ncbi:carboxypeptidase-like regulatory domain-containing protein [Gilvibacter sp.]|uniref:carboxypeptidase-like regulatory domain-containing protein n=1 Tax=Gilvibacter sp. TaxID=2729997 RepID=UPI0035BE54C7
MKSNFKSGLLKSLSFMGLCLMLSLFANPVFAQARTVSGVVSSTDGPLEGATVILKGSLDYVLTDEDGKFEFPRELNKDDVLLITALGLEDAEVVIEADTNFISPILADDPVVIIAALRTEPSKKSQQPEQQ